MQLKPQEIPYEHPDSKWRFDPREKRLVATPAAIEMYQADVREAINHLCSLAAEKGGLDHLQVFESNRPETLWIIEDDVAITALLPSEY